MGFRAVRPMTITVAMIPDAEASALVCDASEAGGRDPQTEQPGPWSSPGSLPPPPIAGTLALGHQRMTGRVEGQGRLLLSPPK
jgi:hypothetical protein